MPIHLFDLRSALPATFPSLLLPAVDVPVLLDDAELCRLRIDMMGRAECPVPEDLHRGLARGTAVIKPVLRAVPVGGDYRAEILRLEIAAIL